MHATLSIPQRTVPTTPSSVSGLKLHCLSSRSLLLAEGSIASRIIFHDDRNSRHQSIESHVAIKSCCKLSKSKVSTGRASAVPVRANTRVRPASSSRPRRSASYVAATFILGNIGEIRAATLFNEMRSSLFI
jgi:hypothetical protein